MNILLFFFILFNIGDSLAQTTTTSRDRCDVVDCTCRVTRGSSPISISKLSPISRRSSVYFSEDSYLISDKQRSDIVRFANKFSDMESISISVLGYTDGCGSAAYNKELGLNRSREIYSIIKSVLPRANISYKSVGENSGGHKPEARRVDVVVHTGAALTRKIERHPADVYLIDASGSMWSGWRDWNMIINASLKPGSKIYVSMMTGCYNMQSLDSIRPQSGTEIWYSYWIVLDKMRENQSLLIISDFDSNIPLTSREHAILSNMVEEKNITVYTLR